MAVLEKVIAAGNHFSTACKAARISWDTFYNWRDRGLRGDPTLREFIERIDAAEAESEILALSIVTGAAEGLEVQKVTTKIRQDGTPEGGAIMEVTRHKEWRAATWLLEHRHAERYAAMRKVQQSGAITHRQVVVMHDGDDLELEEWSDDGTAEERGDEDQTPDDR